MERMERTGGLMADRPHTFPNLDWETRNTVAAVIEQTTERAEAAEQEAARLRFALGTIAGIHSTDGATVEDAIRFAQDALTGPGR